MYTSTDLIAGVQGGDLAAVGHTTHRLGVVLVQQFHVPAVQVGVQARFVLGPVRTQGTVELGFHAALVLQVPGQAGVVAVDLPAILAGVGHPLTIQIAHRARIWKTEEHGSLRLERCCWAQPRLSHLANSCIACG